MSSGDLQPTFDALDVIGDWHWDIQTDRAYAAPLVAKLFNVDPDRAQAGVHLSEFIAAIHDEDRATIVQLIGDRAAAGSPYIAKYRVRAADGATRWILARGSFQHDAAGAPMLGRGIVLDLTPCQLDETGTAKTGTGPRRGNSPVSAVERLAEYLISNYAAVADEADTELKLLVDLLLLKIGQQPARHRPTLN